VNRRAHPGAGAGARALLVGIVVLGSLVAGCKEERPGVGAAPPGTIEDTDVAFEDVARPERTYFAANDDGQCEVYWAEGDRRSVGAAIRCPREIEPGEKLRLAGAGCIRDSPKPERRVPVRCVKAMFYVRDADRSDGKEYPELHLKARKGGAE